MNKATQNKTIPFTLKPLLAIIPLTVLAACANNHGPDAPDYQKTTIFYDQSATTPESTSQKDTAIPDTQNSTEAPNRTATVKDNIIAESELQIKTGPDLTMNKSTEAKSLRSENLSNTNNSQAENMPEGNDAMTVLVIENPELLSKLGHANITQVSAPQSEQSADSLRRPGKRVFHFGFNQSSLTEEDIDLIEQHADYLKANPELKVTIHGHTDAQGNANYNLKLSQQRATMMVNALIKQGIAKDRIKTIGWGGGYPLVSTLNFAENRRIEIEYSSVHYAANQ